MYKNVFYGREMSVYELRCKICLINFKSSINPVLLLLFYYNIAAVYGYD